MEGTGAYENLMCLHKTFFCYSGGGVEFEFTIVVSGWVVYTNLRFIFLRISMVFMFLEEVAQGILKNHPYNTHEIQNDRPIFFSLPDKEQKTEVTFSELESAGNRAEGSLLLA